MLIIITGGPGKSYCTRLLNKVKYVAFHLQRRDFITIKLVWALNQPVRDYFISPIIHLNAHILYENVPATFKTISRFLGRDDNAGELMLLDNLGITPNLDLVTTVKDLLQPKKEKLFELTRLLEPYYNFDYQNELSPFLYMAKNMGRFVFYHAYDPEEIKILKPISKKVVFIEMRPEFRERTECREVPEEIRNQLKSLSDCIVQNDWEFDDPLFKRMINSIPKDL